MTGSKPRIGTEVASVTTATWGGSQVGVTRSRGSCTGRSLRSTVTPPVLVRGPFRVPSRLSCLSAAVNPVTVRVPVNDSSGPLPATGTVPPGAAPAEVMARVSPAARQAATNTMRIIGNSSCD